MCHQSVGLIARELESRGIPTVTLTSAWSITASVKPPRSAFVDFPLGRTAGKPNDPEGQLDIAVRSLELFNGVSQPGEIVDLELDWNGGDWKARLDTPSKPSRQVEGSRSAAVEDDRTARHDTPQYQNTADAQAADPECPSCVFLEDSV